MNGEGEEQRSLVSAGRHRGSKVTNPDHVAPESML